MFGTANRLGGFAWELTGLLFQFLPAHNCCIGIEGLQREACKGKQSVIRAQGVSLVWHPSERGTR